MRRLTIILIAGAAVAFFGAPSSSQAIPFGTDDEFAKAVRKCDKSLQKEALKFQFDLIKRLGKCTDQALLEAFKDAKNKGKGNPDKTDFAKRALKCEDQLAKALGASGKLDKMNGKISDAYSGDCGVTDASGQSAAASAGYLTGVAAPGGSVNWAQAKLATMTSADALQFLGTSSPQRWAVLDELITRSELDASPSGAPAVDCEGALSHPFLCGLHVDRSGSANVGIGPPAPGKGAWAAMCNYHECEVDDTVSEANVRLATAPGGVDLVQLPLEGSTIYEICRVDEVSFVPDMGGDIRVVRAANSRSLKPAVLDADTVVCIETRGGEGWCDCDGLGIANDYQLCTDHILSNGEDCPDVGGASRTAEVTEEQCFCTSSPNPCGGLLEPACVPTTSCKTHAECGVGERCSSTQGGARCHPGTEQHAQADLSGSSGVGDCYVSSTTQLTVTPIGGDSGGICASGDSGGPDGADSCNPLGGDGCTDCRPKVGLDGVPCTADDLLPRTAPATIPITTGNADSRVSNAIQSGGVGTCSIGGQPCIEERNCAGRCSAHPSIFCNENAECPDAVGGETCDGTQGNCTGVVLINVVTPTLSGVPIACDGYETSDLGGWEYVNSFSFADAATLADGTNRSRFICK